MHLHETMIALIGFASREAWLYEIENLPLHVRLHSSSA